MRGRTAPLAVLLLAALLAPAGAAARDTDGDGLRDAFERRMGLTSPRLADSDGDGIVDSAEDEDDDELGALGEQRFGTDPARADSDGDGILDGREDHDGDGRPNAFQQHARRVPPDVRPSLATAADDISKYGRRCGVHSGKDEVDRCRFGDRDSDTSVVLMGDSKALMYLPPMIDVAEAEGWRLETMIKGRCTPVLGTMPRYQRLFDDGASCRSWRRAAFREMRQDPPDLIVLTFSDDYTLVDRRNRKVTGEQKVRALRQGMAATMAELPATSQVVLLEDAPKQTQNPAGCLRRDPSDMSACVTRRVPAAARQVEMALQEAVEAGGGAYRTLEASICPYKPCPLVQGDVLVYRDQGHLTVTFTRRLTPALRAELAPLLPTPPEDAPKLEAPSADSSPPVPSSPAAQPSPTMQPSTSPSPSEPGEVEA